MPTVEQAFAAIRACQALSDMYQVIHIFRYDIPRKIIYILAGQNENLGFTIDINGKLEVEDA